ncbi:tRNA 2-thiouridine(34) synthase MnmA [bacterium]|jgi:tRNA-specific 2-thiouridylase|nr:tRNA 2-thiouridine(34) synthase MnmA [bacterium]MDP6571254.1 tRNA 2-thiouridine(34) synthase MnmA [Patescibacteria group bacterium]MDP6756354.1 tRNA 2-thiouridine(34) synthase MnmA [Patescibacteria group bacterium]|tara:strand:+ start:42089 stop:43153 length:1065 start_codon:yes stop_codon:yes gene_type:complete
MSNSNTTIAVGMSGGVDSSVSAALLKEQGYNVVGFFMKNFGDTYGLKVEECPWLEDREDAMRVASKLDIPFHTLDFEEEYKNQVLDYFFKEYEAGRTPNPDVMCNSQIKFGVFLDKALELGAAGIATGHYVRKSESNDLLKGIDENKDQSYFLYRLNQKQLSKAMFPVGNHKKPEVRELAKKFNLPNHDKRDSQGVCFIGHVDLRKFLSQKIKEKPGDIVNVKGEKIGQHSGLFWYTIGQRRGIDIGGIGPFYVLKRDFRANKLIVTNNPKHEELYALIVKINDVNWISGKEPNLSKTYEGRVRYREKLSKCKVKSIGNNKYEIKFQEPQWAVASGQSVVLYNKDVCLGGGIVI